ncbi:Methyltransferase domain family [Synechococcus sp. PCC 7335]|uniref:class I SAM-dependent methyltransferase n=1 Tax=Synechococcus sp. (strain ATCC 29403 / PCC 7335) TaxID=91464 RepID=UPI00017ED989|nr:methyltransferase [Synechococcus sp. PCC 7335]EDX85685.1 Methyltransferase domain family [Synechococcus sp. PCC 7335]
MSADSSAFLHTTPLEAVTQRLHKSITVGSKTFQIAYPGNADELLDHPSTQDAFHVDQYMPYWAELWPSSQMLSNVLIQQTWPANHRALEIGCGVGLAGIVALSLGMHVTFSDYDATAVEFAAENAIANGFTHFDKLPLDWRFPPNFQVPLLLAADVIYEERNIAPLVTFIQTVLEPGGICLLSDSDRSTKGEFRYALKQANLRFERQSNSVEGYEGHKVKGSVYRIYR